MVKNKKLLIILGIVLLVILLAVGYFLYKNRFVKEKEKEKYDYATVEGRMKLLEQLNANSEKNIFSEEERAKTLKDLGSPKSSDTNDLTKEERLKLLDSLKQ